MARRHETNETQNRIMYFVGTRKGSSSDLKVSRPGELARALQADQRSGERAERIRGRWQRDPS